MNHGSLFSGIGGFDLAAEWMGWNNVFHCEWNEFGKKILKYYWPNAISYDDITKTDFTIHRGSIDILTGGFPCQPYSAAGKRLGTEDNRHLWPEMLRAIREIQPSYIVGENVRGLTNWNGGMVFDQVQADLENEGYEITPFLLPACAVNAPHRRDRIWFIAYHQSEGWSKGNRPEINLQRREMAEPGQERNSLWNDTRASDTTASGLIAHTGSEQFQERTQDNITQDREEIRTGMDNRIERPLDIRNVADSRQPRLQGSSVIGSIAVIGQNGNKQFARCLPSTWQNFPTQSPVRKRNDGFSRQLVRYLTPELYYEISNTSQENRIENLQEVWDKISQEKIWEQIRGLYSLESKDILFQTMQLYQTGNISQNDLSPFSENVSGNILQKLRKFGEFRRSPQGQELQKQRDKQFGDALSFLPHEIPLAAKAFTSAISKFDAWHRNESIKGYGNAVVPELVYQIFKAIELTKL